MVPRTKLTRLSARWDPASLSLKKSTSTVAMRRVRSVMVPKGVPASGAGGVYSFTLVPTRSLPRMVTMA